MKDGRNIIIAALLVAVLTMSIGYAAFATTLDINGNAEIKGTWDVEITGIKATSTTGDANGGEPTFTKTSATFKAELTKPGDSVVYTVTVENNGSIDATLTDFQLTPQEDGSNAIKYEYTEPLESLSAGSSTTFTVTVTYDSSVTEMPEVLTKTATGVVEYSQAE